MTSSIHSNDEADDGDNDVPTLVGPQAGTSESVFIEHESVEPLVDGQQQQDGVVLSPPSDITRYTQPQIIAEGERATASTR